MTLVSPLLEIHMIARVFRATSSEDDIPDALLAKTGLVQ